jgi:hypothetical protein
MTVYFNWSRRGEQSEARAKSQQAGEEVMKGLEAGIEVLRPVERGETIPTEARERVVTALRKASNIYRELETAASPDPVPVGSSMRRALLGAVTCSETLGAALRASTDLLNALLHPEPSPSSSEIFSPKTLMRLARLVTLEASNHLSSIPLEASNFPTLGRRVAADLVIIQLLGIITAELLERWALATELQK